MNIYVLLFVLSESGFLLIAKNLINQGIHPYWLTSLSGVTAALALIIAALMTKKVSRKEITINSIKQSLPTTIAFTLNTLLAFLALKFITATNYNFLARTNLLMIPVLSFWLLKEKIKMLLFPLLLIMLLGVWLLSQTSLGALSLIGSGLALASALTIGLDFIWQKQAALNINKNVVAFWRRLIASLMVGVFWMATPSLGKADYKYLPVLGLLSLLHFISSLALVKGLTITRVAEFNLQATLSPVVTALIAGWWLKETLAPIQTIGAGLIMTSIIVYNWYGKTYDSRSHSH